MTGRGYPSSRRPASDLGPTPPGPAPGAGTVSDGPASGVVSHAHVSGTAQATRGSGPGVPPHRPNPTRVDAEPLAPPRRPNPSVPTPAAPWWLWACTTVVVCALAYAIGYQLATDNFERKLRAADATTEFVIGSCDP